jgi:hypothetical protein
LELEVFFFFFLFFLDYIYVWVVEKNNLKKILCTIDLGEDFVPVTKYCVGMIVFITIIIYFFLEFFYSHMIIASGNNLFIIDLSRLAFAKKIELDKTPLALIHSTSFNIGHTKSPLERDAFFILQCDKKVLGHSKAAMYKESMMASVINKQLERLKSIQDSSISQIMPQPFHFLNSSQPKNIRTIFDNVINDSNKNTYNLYKLVIKDGLVIKMSELDSWSFQENMRNYKNLLIKGLLPSGRELLLLYRALAISSVVAPSAYKSCIEDSFMEEKKEEKKQKLDIYAGPSSLPHTKMTTLALNNIFVNFRVAFRYFYLSKVDVRLVLCMFHSFLKVVPKYKFDFIIFK